MPSPSTKNWWPFPPTTREVQLDEKWAFVSQKEKSCDPLDPLDRLRGDDWDHTAVDPESRLLLALVPGKRDGDACKDLVQQVHNRTAGRTDLLITSDEPAPSETAIKVPVSQIWKRTASGPAGEIGCAGSIVNGSVTGGFATGGPLNRFG